MEARSAYNGVGLVKVMGREAGFIAAGATLANQEVNFTLIPEVPLRLHGPKFGLDPDNVVQSMLSMPEWPALNSEIFMHTVMPNLRRLNLITERTGSKPGTMGGFFKLNPRVDDIPDRFSADYRGIKLLELTEAKASRASGTAAPR